MKNIRVYVFPFIPIAIIAALIFLGDRAMEYHLIQQEATLSVITVGLLVLLVLVLLIYCNENTKTGKEDGSNRMDKFLLSTPGLIITGIGALAILWLLGKLLGASFFFIAAAVIVFLIILITYLVFRLHDEPLLERIKHRLGIAEPDKEEEN